MNNKNYYQILGVEPSASGQDIKAAYRKLALIYHPDKNANDRVAEDVFKEINEAYRVLSNKQQRAAYHRHFTDISQNSTKSGTPFFSTELMQLQIIKLQKAVTEADPYRMNTEAIFYELQGLFSAFHLAVVQKENNVLLNNAIVIGSLSILAFLPAGQQKVILKDLAKLSHDRHREVQEFEKKQRTRLFFEKYKIWMVLILSALICFALYLVISGS